MSVYESFDEKMEERGDDGENKHGHLSILCSILAGLWVLTPVIFFLLDGGHPFSLRGLSNPCAGIIRSQQINDRSCLLVGFDEIPVTSPIGLPGGPSLPSKPAPFDGVDGQLCTGTRNEIFSNMELGKMGIRSDATYTCRDGTVVKAGVYMADLHNKY